MVVDLKNPYGVIIAPLPNLMSGISPLGSLGTPMGSTRIGAIAGSVPASAVAPSLGSRPIILSLTGQTPLLLGRGGPAGAGVAIVFDTGAGAAGLGVTAAFIKRAPLAPFSEADTADEATVVLYSSWLISPFERSRLASRSLASPVDGAVRIVAASSAVKMPLDCKSCTSGFDADW